MIAVVIGVLVVLVVAAIIWARVGVARSENRSVETYEHALGVLGEVSKRTESTGFRILPHEETGRPHVERQIDPAGGEAPEVSEGRGDAGFRPQGPAVPRRLPPAGEPKLRLSGPIRPRDRPVPPAGATDGPDGEEQEAPVTPPAIPAGSRARLGPSPRPMPGTGDARARVAAYKSASDRRRQVMARRTATGATAAVALAAIVAAGVYLSSSGGRGDGHKGPTTTTTPSRRGGGATSTTSTSTTTTTTLPTTLRPTSLSPVTFSVPSSSYTLAFQTTGGACWVGIERTTAGPWLFNQTLTAGQSATYKGSGALIVRVGAPPYIGLTVNGLKAELPTRATQAYSFDLTPATT